MPIASILISSAKDTTTYGQINDNIKQLMDFLVALPSPGVTIVSDNDPGDNAARIIEFTVGSSPRRFRISSYSKTCIKTSLLKLDNVTVAGSSTGTSTYPLQGRIINVLYSDNILVVQDICPTSAGYAALPMIKMRSGEWLYILDDSYVSDLDNQVDTLFPTLPKIQDELGQSIIVPSQVLIETTTVRFHDVTDYYVAISSGADMFVGILAERLYSLNGRFFYVKYSSNDEYIHAFVDVSF